MSDYYDKAYQDGKKAGKSKDSSIWDSWGRSILPIPSTDAEKAYEKGYSDGLKEKKEESER